MCTVVVSHQSGRAGRKFCAVHGIFDMVLHRQGLVPQSRNTHAYAHRLSELNGRFEGQVGICQDNTDIQKGLSLLKKTKMDKVLNARLLHISEVIGIVDMTLRVQVAVTDLNWMVEMKMRHAGNYTRTGIRYTFPKRDAPDRVRPFFFLMMLVLLGFFGFSLVLVNRTIRMVGRGIESI
jgi:hypothetical protein